MTPYERLSAELEAREERYGPNRCCVPVSTAGGRTRYVWLMRDAGGGIRVTLFDHLIADARPDGSTDVSAAGYFTATTRDALSWVVSGHAQAARLSTPGSRGGAWTDAAALMVTPRGKSFVLLDGGESWVTIPAEVFA